MIILAVDPGLATGLALNIDGEYETLVVRLHKDVYDLILQTPIEVIVIEQFITSNIHSHKFGIITTELVGACEALAYAKGIPFHRRTNHHRLPHVTRATQIIRAKKRSYEGHEVAALAHLLGWEKFHPDANKSINMEAEKETRSTT